MVTLDSPLADSPPYETVLSALRKTDLIRVSLEFKLPTDGPVTMLRGRLRYYLNFHRDRVFRNPRYCALYPRIRQPNFQRRRSPSSTLPTFTPPFRSPARTPSP